MTDLIPTIAALLSQKMIGLGIALEVSKCEKFIQQDLYENHLKGSAEDDTPQTGWRGKGLADFRRLLQDAYTSDLTRYAFDKSDCLHCVHNTNTYDMFAETNSCGHCTDRECLQAKNAAFVLEKSRALLKVDPRIVVANCSYGYTNPVVRQNLEEEGHTVKKVGFGYRTLPAEPQAPQAEQFREANEYEQAVVRYEMQRQEYEQTLQEALQQAEAGAIRLMVSPEPTDARLIAIPVNHREKEPDFVKRLSQEKQANVERAITKTVEDTRKMMRKEQMEAPVFSAFDENVLLYCLLDALRHDHLALFGEKYRESHYLTDADKLEIVKNLTPEQRDIIRHDYIVEALSKKGESKIVGQMIMEYANIHYNRQFSLIKAGHEETCENRNDRLDERIAEFQAKERVKKEQEKKKRKKQAVTETQAVTAVSAAQYQTGVRSGTKYRSKSFTRIVWKTHHDTETDRRTASRRSRRGLRTALPVLRDCMTRILNIFMPGRFSLFPINPARPLSPAGWSAGCSCVPRHTIYPGEGYGHCAGRYTGT